MQLKLSNISHSNIILFDIEYDSDTLVQIAFLILGAKEPSIFEVQKSVNLYIKPNHLLSPFFVNYTNIDNDYLCRNGIDLARAKALVNSVILDFNLSDTLLVGHGMENDLRLLQNLGFCVDKLTNRYDTYKHARKLLKRGDRLRLQDLATECGYCIFNEHNAYSDCLATFFTFAWLNELEGEQDAEGSNNQSS